MNDEPAISFKQQPSIVVIGYGNDVRRDDAVGIRTAEAVSAWNLPDVQVITVQQLTPELAERIAQARLVIFLDAYELQDEPANSNDESLIHTHLLTPTDTAYTLSSLDHTGDPRYLLALTQAVYGYVPPTYWITVPARHVDFGWDMSPLTRSGMVTALRLTHNLIVTARRYSDNDDHNTN
ncbi:MAG: hydrogenase maturation protease [Chloroflexi bacterium AL-W]|nr:hydrogenase maturation protease [Chloroflexi bacterium AL-N1]NOK66307.1 hydrogenase maturation protease [Chloroflexi bacterium AL-N10]NOK73187.1 hydrogenase maturation protease [Chloroflexi bacterium AL-N5]NOK80084.1 hydrogenase maturation protease [Chloroflexi bacterium AL-W]NOK88061.1 hydrogenase maturation protease [Chloroflexi bacterium AL-N15]